MEAAVETAETEVVAETAVMVNNENGEKQRRQRKQ
jgi:hypothetical protein